MDTKKAQNWLRSAPTGSRLCYHEGHLANDRRELIWTGSRFTEKDLQPVCAVGHLMWDAYCIGKVMLFQERREAGGFRYWASKRRM